MIELYLIGVCVSLTCWYTFDIFVYLFSDEPVLGIKDIILYTLLSLFSWMSVVALAIMVTIVLIDWILDKIIGN